MRSENEEAVARQEKPLLKISQIKNNASENAIAIKPAVNVEDSTIKGKGLTQVLLKML
jgi:hypothetical protein